MGARLPPALCLHPPPSHSRKRFDPVVDRLQFKPDIESIHGSAREEVPDRSGSAQRRQRAPNHRAGLGRRSVDRRDEFRRWRAEGASPAPKDSDSSPIANELKAADSEGLATASAPPPRALSTGAQGKDVYCHMLVLQEVDDRLQCL